MVKKLKKAKKYQDRVVCFIDILGFKQHINDTIDKNGDDDEKKISAIADAFEIIRTYLEMDEKHPISKGVEITHFSDCIVITFKTNVESGVFYALLHLLWVQMSLIRNGMLIRGAIVRGKLTHTKREIFGPALIDAYEMEQSAAIYPRIVLDADIIETGIKNKASHNLPQHELESIMHLLKKDSDGMYYLDYLGLKSLNELDDAEYESYVYLLGIRELIVVGLKYKNPSLKIKYKWMKEKFNASIKEMKKGIDFSEEPELKDAYLSIQLIK